MHKALLAASAALIVVASVAVTSVATAQDWPTRPITLVIPFAAGGGIDASARVQALHMGELLGQTIVAENIGAAAGMAGSQRVAKSPPDGYTFLIGNTGTHAYNQTLYKKPLYNAMTDFDHVALFSDSARVLIARSNFPANTFPEFVAYAKAHHNTMQYGSAGAGSGTHVCAVLLNVAMDTKIVHVPYRGAGPAMQDLIGGRIDFIAEQISTALPQIEGKSVKAIVTLGLDRAPGVESLATAEEQGIKGLDCGSWGSFSFPKGTPAAIVQRLAKASNEAVETPALRERFKGIGVTIPSAERRTPEYLTKFVASETERWAGPIKASGVSED
jgi:tripartite-type tricarboxylate transporter receptor subunit TctC